MVLKGTHQDVDSYSAFQDNDHKSKTEMTALLRQVGLCQYVRRLDAGVALRAGWYYTLLRGGLGI